MVAASVGRVAGVLTEPVMCLSCTDGAGRVKWAKVLRVESQEGARPTGRKPRRATVSRALQRRITPHPHGEKLLESWERATGRSQGKSLWAQTGQGIVYAPLLELRNACASWSCAGEGACCPGGQALLWAAVSRPAKRLSAETVTYTKLQIPVGTTEKSLCLVTWRVTRPAEKRGNTNHNEERKENQPMGTDPEMTPVKELGEQGIKKVPLGPER